MPTGLRQPRATLRHSKSIPVNILHRTAVDENEQVKRETAQQHAVLAARRALQRASEAGIANTKKRSTYNNGQPLLNVQVSHRTSPVRVSRRRSLQLTDDTLVDEASPRFREPGSPLFWRHLGDYQQTTSVDASDIHQPNYTTLPADMRLPADEASSYQRLNKPKLLRGNSKSETPVLSPPISNGRETPTLRRSLRSSPAGKAPTGSVSPSRSLLTAGEVLQQLPNPYQTSYNQELAVQIARDEYQRQTESQQSIAAAPSGHEHPKLTRHFRRTLRTADSLGELRVTEAEAHPGVIKDDESSRSRRLSNRFKATFKRLFHSNPCQPFPAQQIHARRCHYYSADGDVTVDPVRNPIIPLPPTPLVARLSVRPSSDTFRDERLAQLSAPAPSIRTVHSRESLQTRSRLTSWANTEASKTTNPLTRPESFNGDRSRLSIIRENLHRQPTILDSATNRLTGYAAFERPIHYGQLDDPVETEKMLTKLQHEIEKRSRQQGSEDALAHTIEHSSERRIVFDQVTDEREANRRKGSVRSTIRRVTEDDAEGGNPRSQQLPTGKKKALRDDRNHDLDEDDNYEEGLARPLRHKRSFLKLSRKLSLQEMANINEGHAASKRHTLRESRSAFFSSRANYQSGQLSPWQMARRANTTQSKSKQRRSLYKAREPTPSSESCSDYSRKTSGTLNAGTVLENSERKGPEPGTAWIIETKPAINIYRRLASRAQDPVRTASHQSSGSWKGWMNTEMSKLEGTDDYEMGIKLPQDEVKLTGIGHVREAAEDSRASLEEQKRHVSGPKQAMEAIRKLSGFRASRETTAESVTSAGNSQRASSHGGPVVQKLRNMVPAIRAVSDENKAGRMRAWTATTPTLQIERPKQTPRPSESTSLAERPKTPFAKVSTSQTPFAESYSLRQRAGVGDNQRHSLERENRLRRMRSSLLTSGKPSPRGPEQYPWLQRYRDSHFTEDLSPVDVNRGHPGLFPKYGYDDNKENEPEWAGGDHDDDDNNDYGSEDMERFPKPRQRAVSDTPAFI